MKIGRFLALVVPALVLTAAAGAQDSADLGLSYAKVQQAGMEQLKQYTWQSATRVTREGEIKAEFTVTNRLNEKGEMVQEVEEGEVNARKKRGMRGRSQDKQLAEAAAFLDKVAAAMGAYIFMSKGQEVDFFDKAAITAGAGADAGMQVVQAKGVLVSEDVVTKWIDPATLYPSKIVFDTVVDGTAIQGEVLFRPIEGGPNVPRMATITIPEGGRVIETEFLHFKKAL